MRRLPAIAPLLLGCVWIAAVPPAGAAAGPEPARAPQRHPGGRDPQPRLENRTLAVFGLGQHYLEGGRGRPVVFLHGLLGTAEGWRLAAAALSADVRVFVPDQIGFGASDKPHLDYSLGTLVDLLAEFMARAGIEKASLVGHDMGARVACLFALAHPEKVESLVLVSGAGYRPDMAPEVTRALDFSTIAGARGLLSLLYYDDAAHATDEAARRLFAERLRSGSGLALSRILESDQRGEGFADDLTPIRAPTLIIWGRDDEIAPSSIARKAQGQIAGSKTILLERCGHVPMVEAPDLLYAALKDFLLAQPASGPAAH